MKSKTKAKAKPHGKRFRSKRSQGATRRRSEKAVFAAALRLPMKERAHIAGQLLLSLDEHEKTLSPEEHEAAWDQEIARRLSEVDEGLVEPVPWEQARRRIVSDDEPARRSLRRPS